ncbi:MAG: insulinase family protein, partial [Candidatus Schekmanbacteria bacterium]
MKSLQRICYLILAILILFPFTSCSSFSYRKGNSKDNMKVKTLKNGLKVIVKETHSSPVVSFHMWVKTGSSYENDKTRGMSHLLEHMLFKGTKKRKVGEIAKEIDSAGGMINAFTSKDVTVYYLTIASRFFDTGIDIISDAIMNSELDEKELEKEKKVVLEEIRMGEDDPERSSYKGLFLTAYDVHPYRYPVIGYKETVSAVTRDTLMKYYKERYIPSNMTLVIAGDVNCNEAFKKAAEAFKNFKDKPLKNTPLPKEPSQKELKFKTAKKSVKQAFVKIAFHIPGIASKDVPAIDLLASILGEGDSSRLYKKLKLESALANSVYAYSMTPKNPGLFIVSLSTEPNKLDKALLTTLKELKKITAEEIDENELQKAKTSIESSTIYAQETVNGIAQNIGSNITLTGDINFEEKYLKRV